MSEDSVRAALRSGVPLVLVEAPAGCGKTRQGADYARELAADGSPGRVLVLTHTHAACSMFCEHTKGAGSLIEIRTIDSLIMQIASVYHAGLGLPADAASWAREQKDGHARLAVKVASLFKSYPMIAASLARRYPTLICDEHQDSSGDQHSVAMGLLGQGARVRIFGDPMQDIFKDAPVDGAGRPYKWDELKRDAGAFEELDIPHRWSNGCPDLGQWTLEAREALKAGGKVDLTGALPRGVQVVFAENLSRKRLGCQLSGADRKPADRFVDDQASLLILTRYNEAARSFRSFFYRQISLWEGHTRPALEGLVDATRRAAGDPAGIAAAVAEFVVQVGTGFGSSAFGDRLVKEAQQGCTGKAGGKTSAVQEIARFLVAEPSHRGVGKALRRLWELHKAGGRFSSAHIDCPREFWDAVGIGDFESPESGLAEITHRRTYSRPKPPEKAISTIHKAKGLECESVILMPCDAHTFPDKWDARCLLYVAISRAKNRLMLVVSRSNPSPLLRLA